MYYVCFASLTAADRNIVAYIEANQVYAHLITIRTKTVTNIVMVLKDTITKYKTRNRPSTKKLQKRSGN